MENNVINNENEMKQVLYFDGKDPDTICYIILKGYPETSNDWSLVVGRQVVYDELIEEIREYDLDPEKSYIITMPCARLSDIISVWEFMTKCKKENLVYDDTDFDVSEYNYNPDVNIDHAENKETIYTKTMLDAFRDTFGEGVGE